jgi:hypothetical protein
VLDEQLIAQAIKALRAEPLHSHLVREQPKTVPEFYDQFAKFSKSEVQHFCKLEQQRKVPKSDEAPKSPYDDNQCNYPRPVHNISPDGGLPPENWGKNSRGPPQQRDSGTFDQRHPIQPKGRRFKPWPRTQLRTIHTEDTILHVPWRQGRPPHKRLPYLP